MITSIKIMELIFCIHRRTTTSFSRRGIRPEEAQIRKSRYRSTLFSFRSSYLSLLLLRSIVVTLLILSPLLLEPAAMYEQEMTYNPDAPMFGVQQNFDRRRRMPPRNKLVGTLSSHTFPILSSLLLPSSLTH